MKQFSSILLVVLTFISHDAISQNLIAVQNGGNPTFYQQVDSAIVHSQDGDTIFIPGGAWNINVTIDKRLHIIGVGHNPDSTAATFPTKFISFLLASGASHGSVSGIYVEAHIAIRNYESVNYYDISRCNIGVFELNSQCSNFILSENIIRSYISGRGAFNCSFFNNIFTGSFATVNPPSFVNSVFRNNIFLYPSYCDYGCSLSITAQFSLFENNIFASSTRNLIGVSNSTFNNNLFFEDITTFPGTNVGSNCIINQPQNSIFINVPNIPTFSYQNDYNLQPNCPGKNAGTDGTDLGIYGGIYPWKPGSVPFNPHFQTVNISPVTNTSGNLPVNIKVSAQDY